MKILHVINGLWPGGAQIMMLRMAEVLRQRDIDIDVFSLTKASTIEPQLKALGIGVEICKSKPEAIRKLRRTLKTGDMDLVQCWMYTSNLATEIARTGLWQCKVPVFWSIHHSVPSLAHEQRSTRFTINALKLFKQRPNKIVYVSKISRTQHESLGYPPGKSVHIPNGYDLTLFSKCSEGRTKFRDEIKAGDEHFVIGCLGRFHEHKDQRNFLEAAKISLQKEPKLRFVIAGRDCTTDNETLMQWVNDLGLKDHVHVLGDRRDVPSVLNGLDLLTTSSKTEAFSIIIGEGMATQVPCTVTDVGDSAYLVGDDALVAPPCDPAGLSDVWLNVAAQSESDRLALGLQLRQRIEQNFSIESVVDRYLDLYRESLSVS